MIVDRDVNLYPIFVVESVIEIVDNGTGSDGQCVVSETPSSSREKLYVI